MADAVVKARDAGAIFVGLSGNVHSRRIKGVPGILNSYQPLRTWLHVGSR